MTACSSRLETCHGDFDIATNDYTVTGGKTPTSGDIRMVHCKNPYEQPPTPVVATPDAGP